MVAAVVGVVLRQKTHGRPRGDGAREPPADAAAEGEQNEILLADAPSHPWVCPFLLAPFCLGACCVHCKARGADPVPAEL